MEKTACLIVDVQQSVVAALPDGGEELTEKLSRLITWCRQQMVPLVYVRHDDGEDRISEIDSRIKPKESEIVIDKSYPSAFLETDLESWCSEQGITQLIVAGMMTEFCIDATIKSAFERGYQVLVPQGCCATVDNEYLTAQQTEEFFEKRIWQGRYAQIFSLESLLSQPVKKIRKQKKSVWNFPHALFMITVQDEENQNFLSIRVADSLGIGS